ncbi:MarR family transcriptional regulator, partial [Streptomyces sp. T-3]|nr:MarR family transcriptional regulator [Streptomyces sp. T-3]
MSTAPDHSSSAASAAASATSAPAPAPAPAPATSAPSAPFSAGEVLTLISTGAAATRADVARLTGLARSTASQRVDALIAHGFVDEDNADGGSTG